MVFRRRPVRRPRRRVNPFKKISTGIRVARKAIGGIKRLHRSLNPSANVCDVVENFYVGECRSGVPYAQFVTLAMCARALSQAPFYQEYRITAVQMCFQAYADAFGNTTGGTGIALTIPQLLFITQPNGYMLAGTQNYETMLEMGAKPVKFERDIIRSFQPTVNIQTSYNSGSLVQNGSTSASTAAGVMLKKSPWLSTKSYTSLTDQVPHYGALYYFDQRITSQSTPLGCVTLKIHIQFRKPYNKQGEGATIPSYPTNPQRSA